MNEDVDFGNILVVAIYKKSDPLPPHIEFCEELYLLQSLEAQS